MHGSQSRIATVADPARVAATLFVVCIAVATVAGLGVAATGPSPSGADAANATQPDAYAIVQGDRCTEISPVSGDEPVEDAYDYRNPYTNRTGNPEADDYSAHGFTEYQQASVTTMFVYREPTADSLVVIHGERGASDSVGSTVTFAFENLPRRGEWAVQDDDYPNRDDDWAVETTETTVDWVWASERTDGGAYRGVEDASTPILIEPRFNEDAARWGEWPYSGSSEYRMEGWRVITGDNRAIALDRNEPLVIHPGGCDSLPRADARVNPSESEIPLGDSVTFTAEATGDGASLPVIEYRWDFDGDGQVDRTTTSPEVEHRYETAGRYDATVQVETAAGTGSPASTTVDVGQPDQAVVSVASVNAEDAVADEPTPVAVEVVNEGGAAGSVDLTVTADGDVVGSRTVDVEAGSSRTVTVEATFPEPGEYEVSVGGTSDTVTVSERSAELSVTSLDVDEIVRTGRPLTAVATVENVGNVDEEFDVELLLGDDVAAERTVSLAPGESRTVTLNTTVDEPGTYTARVGEETAAVEVIELDGELAAGSIAADDPIEAGEEVTITVTVENVGNEAGEFDVPLELFGQVVSIETVSLSGGESQTVEYTVRIDEPGTYTARVGGATTDVEVTGDGTEETTTTEDSGSGSPLPTPGLGVTAAVVAAALFLAIAVVRRRRQRS